MNPLWQEVSSTVPPAEEVVRVVLRIVGALVIGTINGASASESEGSCRQRV